MQKETNYITKEDVFDVINRIEIVLSRANGKIFFTQLLRQIVEQIEKLPEADVRPVAMGEWKNGHCSVCGIDVASRLDTWTSIQKFQFCPFCGTGMRDTIALEDAAQDADCGAMAPAT